MSSIRFILLLLMMISTPLMAADTVSSAGDVENPLVVKQESKSAFKGLLYKVWSRLRALNPQLKTNKTRQRSVATMGIRGAETTTSLIEPYWKGDKSEDPGYIAELTSYTEAQQYAEDGDLQKAVTALNSFLQEYESSDLKPNAQFALAISQGGLGDVAASKKTLQMFVDENPKHPLVSDARQVIASCDVAPASAQSAVC